MAPALNAGFGNDVRHCDARVWGRLKNVRNYAASSRTLTGDRPHEFTWRPCTSHTHGAARGAGRATGTDGAAGRCELSGADAVVLLDLFTGAERDAEEWRYLQRKGRRLTSLRSASTHEEEALSGRPRGSPMPPGFSHSLPPQWPRQLAAIRAIRPNSTHGRVSRRARASSRLR